MSPAEKKALRNGLIIDLIDGVGFYLLLGLVKSPVQRGATPIIKSFLPYDRLWMINAIRAGNLYIKKQPGRPSAVINQLKQVRESASAGMADVVANGSQLDKRWRQWITSRLFRRLERFCYQIAVEI